MTRRLSAAVLALVFSFGLIAPMVSAPATTLPACCRNKGKHGCHGKAGHDGPAVQTTRCSEFPAVSMPTPIVAGTVATSADGFHLVAVEPVSSTSAAPRPAQFERAHSERGPPSLLA